MLGLSLGICATVWLRWMHEGAELGKKHLSHQLSHPGWSFPAHIWSPEVELDSGLSPKRLLAEAKARGYHNHCPNPVAGEYCETNNKLVPKNGKSLEPVMLGTLIGADAELRTHLPLEEAPKHLVDAIIASEDRDFRSHRGVNFSALIRAVFANTKQQGYSQGGSTLTMQVVRNLSQKTEKKISRKLREMGLAMGLDRALGKDAVLQMYLDAPYLGQRGNLSVCGFEEAAKHYFGKGARELDLSEAATLVAILPGPGKLAPDKNPDACLARRDRILKAMGEIYGYDVREALRKPIVVQPYVAEPDLYPGYMNAVRAKLEAELPKADVYGAGLEVQTGIDLSMQTEAERLFPLKTKAYAELIGAKKDPPLQAVGVSLDINTGSLRALYGGIGAVEAGFNRATQAHRQPGSSFKPVVYALAMSQTRLDGTPVYTASSTEPNSPRDFKTPQGIWHPFNVGGEATPTASLAQALTWSQNIATASLLEQMGGPKVLIDFAKKAGFDTKNFPDEMGLALGQGEVTPVEMAQFAGMVANGGFRIEASPVWRAVDLAGHERIHPPAPHERVLSAESAALTRELMRLVIDYGTGGGIRGAAGDPGFSGPAIGKTGTTDSERDIWFIGATPRVATVVWLGYDLPAPVGGSAADFAAPLWGWWMGHTIGLDLPLPDFPKEPKLQKIAICTETGLIPNPSCKNIVASFLPGTGPKTACAVEHPAEDPSWNPAAHESIWKRKEREAAADAGVAPSKLGDE
ncbi:MAG: transglycosylase domain-containing protein [Myxococcaceae bacterium]